MRTWNVSGRYGSLLSSLLVLSGCTGAVDPDVSFLSFSLPSLKNTGSSPFRQELEKTGYIELQGTCDKAITNFQFQLDRNGWKTIPSSPGMAPPGVTFPAKPYDVDCSDGTFYIYLLEDEIRAALPAGATLETYHPSAVHLRGIAGPFTTEPLTFSRTDDESSPEANFSVLRPLSSRFAVGLCVPVEIQLVYRENGQTGWTGWASNSQDRQISLSLRDFAANSVRFYTDGECQSGLASNVTVPKGELSKRVYLKGTAPTVGYISGKGVGFADAGNDEEFFIEIRTSGAPHAAKFADISRRPDVGSCEDVLVLLYDEDGTLTAPASSDVSIQFAKSSGVTLYGVGGCGGAALTDEPVTFAAGGRPWHAISYRVGETTPNQISIPGGGSLPLMDASYHYVNPWTAARRAVVKIALPEGLAYQAPDCVEMKISLVDKSGNLENRIQAGYSFDYRVSVSYDVSLYDAADCSGTPSTGRTLTFGPGDLEKTLYWKLNVLSTMTNVWIGAWEDIPPGAPSRLEEFAYFGFDIPVVANLRSLGGTVQQVFRLPRAPLPAPVPLMTMEAVKDLSKPLFANTK
ncbi:MAG TPA: hypothetical protein PL182_10610, partial [Pseudobdellovibrionaceae bacterium]|nr:hypothetical protein [Pseudobdellovibrionaceae bacterium]